MNPSDLAVGGFLIAFLVMGAVYLGYPLISVLFGIYVRRKLLALGKGGEIAGLAGFGAAMLLLLLPFADYPWQRHLLNKHCSEEGGLHIKQKVRGVEGVHGLRHAIDYGYQYGEDYLKAGDLSTLRRYYAAPPNSNRGKFSEVKTNTPSPYGFRRERFHVDGSIYRATLQTYKTETGEELGRYVYFENDPSKEGLSINDFRKWMRMTCDGIELGAWVQMEDLLKKTLVPAAATKK